MPNIVLASYLEPTTRQKQDGNQIIAESHVNGCTVGISFGKVQKLDSRNFTQTQDPDPWVTRGSHQFALALRSAQPRTLSKEIQDLPSLPVIESYSSDNDSYWGQTGRQFPQGGSQLYRVHRYHFGRTAFAGCYGLQPSTKEQERVAKLWFARIMYVVEVVFSEG